MNIERESRARALAGAARTRGREKRRAAMVAARERGTHTPAQWRALVKKCLGQCVCCRGVLKWASPDHVVPIALGGSDGIDNLQPLCTLCNRRKKDKHIDYRERFRLFGDDGKRREVPLW